MMIGAWLLLVPVLALLRVPRSTEVARRALLEGREEEGGGGISGDTIGSGGVE
jgi:hypothetical protein